MKNKEKFAKEIVEIATKSQTLAVNQESKVIVCSQLPPKCGRRWRSERL